MIIISFLVLTLTCDSGVLLLGELRCLSLLGVKGLNCFIDCVILRVSPSIALDENKNDDKKTRKLETEQAGSKVKVKSGDTQGMAPSLGYDKPSKYYANQNFSVTIF